VIFVVFTIAGIVRRGETMELRAVKARLLYASGESGTDRILLLNSKSSVAGETVFFDPSSSGDRG
jgi:hypothetical protein